MNVNTKYEGDWQKEREKTNREDNFLFVLKNMKPELWDHDMYLLITSIIKALAFQEPVHSIQIILCNPPIFKNLVLGTSTFSEPKRGVEEGHWYRSSKHSYETEIYAGIEIDNNKFLYDEIIQN